MVPEPGLAVARYPPLGLNATERTSVPAANGEPVTWVSAPVDWLTENTDTLLETALAVARYPPLGLNATENGRVPAANGEPATCSIPSAEGAATQHTAIAI